ncbi:MAG: hypothetical protein MJ246_03190 [Clostridia bacterium]|nr:hypothetical protein [Clostridia bacterium]
MKNDILYTRKFGSIEFDKDELISKIEDFDQFDREGLSLRVVCENEIAKMLGVPAADVYVFKLDWNDPTKYRANYRISCRVDTYVLKRVIREYIHQYGAGIASCRFSCFDGKSIQVNLTLLYTRGIDASSIDSIRPSAIKNMLEKEFPDYDFSVNENINMLFDYES